VVTLLVGRRTCDLQVAGSIGAHHCVALANCYLHLCAHFYYTSMCVPLSQSSIIWYRPRGRSLWVGCMAQR